MSQHVHKAVFDEGARKYVGLSDKIRDESVCRLVVNFLRVGDLLNDSVLHDHDCVAHGQSFLLVVRDVDEGYAELSVHIHQLNLHILAHFQVKRAERFVKQQNLRLVYQRARDCNALLLTARQAVDVAVAVVFEVDHFQRRVYLFLYFALCELALLFVFHALFVHVCAVGHVFELESESDIVENVEVGEQRVFLKNRVDGALVRRQGRYVLAVEKYSALGRRFKARNHAQRSRFAAA